MNNGVDVESWYARYFPLVLRRTRSILRNEDDALDAAQDVFEKALAARKRLTDEFPSALLYLMATRVCLNRLRGRRRDVPFDETMHLAGDGLAGDDAFARIEARLTANAILRQVSEKTRLLLWLYYVDGLSLEETGKVVGLSISGVRKRILKFREQMGRFQNPV